MGEEQYLLGQSQRTFNKYPNYKKLITSCNVTLCILLCFFLVVFRNTAGFVSPVYRKNSGTSAALLLDSPSFQNATRIPKKYGCDYCEQAASSVPLTWRLQGVSCRADNTFVLLVHDPDAISVTGLDFIHWFVINISCTADTLKVPENASGSPLLLPQGSIELSNSNNKTGYHAPCPPDRDHTYIFRICLVKNMSNRNDWSTLYDARDVVRRLEGSLCGFLLGIYPRASEHCKQAS